MERGLTRLVASVPCGYDGRADMAVVGEDAVVGVVLIPDRGALLFVGC